MNRPNVADHSFGMTPRSSNASPPHITKMRTAVRFLARRYCIVCCRYHHVPSQPVGKEDLALGFCLTGSWPFPRFAASFFAYFSFAFRCFGVCVCEVGQLPSTWYLLRKLTMFMVIIRWLDFSRWCRDNPMGFIGAGLGASVKVGDNIYI